MVLGGEDADDAMLFGGGAQKKSRVMITIIIWRGTQIILFTLSYPNGRYCCVWSMDDNNNSSSRPQHKIKVGYQVAVSIK